MNRLMAEADQYDEGEANAYRHLMVNITELGPQTEEALRSNHAAAFDSIGLTEIHKAKAETAGLKAKLRDMGFHAFIAPSAKSDRSAKGTMGGSMTATRKRGSALTNWRGAKTRSSQSQQATTGLQ